MGWEIMPWGSMRFLKVLMKSSLITPMIVGVIVSLVSLLSLPTLSLAQSQGGAQSQDEVELTAQEFIAGNILLTLYHEAGHALISQYRLPVKGNEEDAVDLFSIFALTEELNQGNLSEERELKLDNYLFSTALYWLTMSEEEGFDNPEVLVEHSLDSERFIQHLCMIYGSDPEIYQDLPSDFGVQDLVTEDCAELYQEKTADWFKMLNPHRLGDRIRVDKIVIAEDEPDPRYKGYREWLHIHGILDEFENFMENSFHLQRKITLRLKSCGQANAFWDPEQLEIILCDEQVAEYSHIYDRLIQEGG